MSDGTQHISAMLPTSHVGALSEIAVVSGSSFDEVLGIAVGYALADAMNVYGVTLAESEGGHAD